MTEIKWVTLDNANGEKSLKQHAFIAKVKKDKWTREDYLGNISLCKRVYASGWRDEERAQDFNELDNEPVSNNACKICLNRKRLLDNWDMKEQVKKYATLVVAMSLDFQVGKIDEKLYSENLLLIAQQLKELIDNV